jgi:hypothetical protein
MIHDDIVVGCGGFEATYIRALKTLKFSGAVATPVISTESWLRTGGLRHAYEL